MTVAAVSAQPMLPSTLVPALTAVVNSLTALVQVLQSQQAIAGGATAGASSGAAGVTAGGGVSTSGCGCGAGMAAAGAGALGAPATSGGASGGPTAPPAAPAPPPGAPAPAPPSTDPKVLYPHLTGDLDAGADVMQRLERIAVRMGAPLNIVDGGRTLGEQQKLYDAYKAGKGNRAAAPTPDAPHIKGIAADVYVNGKAFGTVGGAEKIANEEGLFLRVKGEAWHLQL
jgi:hypothetical protein